MSRLSFHDELEEEKDEENKVKEPVKKLESTIFT